MSRDSQRYRKVYSYYRPQPRTELLEIVVDETLDWKNSVRSASTTNHPLTGGTTTLSIGGVTIVNEDRVLLRSQSDPRENGIYYFEVSDESYTLTRASDARQETLSCGAATYVEEGTNSGKVYILSTTNPITVGSTNLVWNEFAAGSGGGGGSSPEYWFSTTTGEIYSTGSVAIRGGLSSVDSAMDIGSDVFFFVSGSISGSGENNKKTVFGGDVRMSGSLAVGYLTNALGIGSIAGGYRSNASGSNSLAIGNSTNTIGFASLSQGNNAIASGSYSHAEGAFTVATGSASHSEGSNTISIGYAAHAEGFETIASGTYSHAEGYRTISIGNYSHTEGGSTIAYGLSSHAEGTGSIAVEKHSHAEGYFTIASGSYQTVVGRTNLLNNDFSLFVVGNGVVNDNPATREAGRSDILRVNTNSVEVTGTFRATNGISGSLTSLTNGTAYILAGPNITINTGSNGAVQITGSAGGGGIGGSGTVDYLSKFTPTGTSIGNSLLSESGTTLTSAGTAFSFTYPQTWTIAENTSALDIVRSGGSTVMKLDSNNYNVGINVSPSDKLHIALNDSQTIDAFSATGSRIIRLQNTNSTNGNSVSIIGSDGSNQMNSYIRFINVDHSQAGAITFGTSNSGGSNKGERLRIDDSGRVGIGTNSVTSKGSDVFFFVSGSRSDDSSGDKKTVFGGDVRISGSLSVGTGSILLTSNNIQFGSSDLRIEKNGSDMKFFDLNNTGGKTLSELAASGGGGSSPQYWVSPSAGYIWSTGSVGIGISVPASSRLEVVEAGSSTTATDNPLSLVTFHGSSVDEFRLKLTSSNFNQANKWLGLGFGYHQGYMKAAIFAQCINDVAPSGRADLHIALETTGGPGNVSPSNTKFTVKNNGNIGIGTTNPSEKLHVDTGNIKVDSDGYGVRLASSPSNADVQTLDSYYEKDLTVTLKSTNSDLDCALYSGAQTLKFTRIGRMVTISGYIQVETVTSTGSGRLYVDLGTASGERPISNTAVAIYINQPDAATDWDNPVVAYADSGTSRIYIDRYSLGQGLSNGLTLSGFVVQEQEFMVSVSYSTN